MAYMECLVIMAKSPFEKFMYFSPAHASTRHPRAQVSPRDENGSNHPIWRAGIAKRPAGLAAFKARSPPHANGTRQCPAVPRGACCCEKSQVWAHSCRWCVSMRRRTPNTTCRGTQTAGKMVWNARPW